MVLTTLDHSVFVFVFAHLEKIKRDLVEVEELYTGTWGTLMRNVLFSFQGLEPLRLEGNDAAST